MAQWCWSGSFGKRNANSRDVNDLDLGKIRQEVYKSGEEGAFNCGSLQKLPGRNSHSFPKWVLLLLRINLCVVLFCAGRVQVLYVCFICLATV